MPAVIESPQLDRTATIPIARIDELCLAFEKAKEAAEVAKNALDDAKATLLTAIEKHGYVPTNADKSRRLDGALYVATSTTGSTVEINDERVARLEISLSKAGKPRLFRELFDRTTKHTMKKGAPEILRAARIPGWRGQRIVELFSLCFKVNSKTPSVSVETATAYLEREAKASRKASKKKAKL